MSDDTGQERGGEGARVALASGCDLGDLLEAAQAAALLLDDDLRLTAFTPAAAGPLHLSEADRGRPAAEIGARVGYAGLAADARRALGGPGPVEREVEDAGTGARYRARLLPRRRADGSAAGLAVAFVDVTAQRQAEARLCESEERQAFLLALSDALRPLATPADIAGTAARHLGERLGASRVCYGRIAGGVLRIARDHARDVPSIVGAHSLAPFDREFLAAYRPGGVIVVGDVAQDGRLGPEARAALGARNIAAFVDVVLGGDDGGTSILAVQDAAPRTWTEAERNLVRQVAERVRSAIELARAEAASRESREHLRLALRAAGMGVFGYDPASDRVEITAESAGIFGLPLDGMPPASGDILAIVHPDDVKRYRSTLLKAAAKAGEWHSEYRVVRPRDGRVAWIEERGSATADPATGLLRVRGVHWDVTARREAQERLLGSEARLSTIFASASVGLSEVTLAGRFLEVNDELCRILGRPREEVLRLDIPAVTHPEDIGPSLAAVAEALRTGSAHLDKRYRRPDGGLVWANSRVTVMRHGDHPDTLLVVTVDLTARRQAEAALRESEARFRQFGEASADILWIRNAETLAFEYLSPAFEEIYGVPLRTVLGGNQILRWAGMVLPEDRRALFDGIRRVREGEHVLHSFRILRADGQVRWIRDTTFPLLDAEGRVQRIAGITRDVTEEVELQDLEPVLELHLLGHVAGDAGDVTEEVELGHQDRLKAARSADS